MLSEFRIVNEFREQFQGVIHIDGSTRVQIITKYDMENQFMYCLLDKIDHMFDIKGLINTSLNSRGKPIVQTEEQAIEEAKFMGLDGVVIDGILQII